MTVNHCLAALLFALLVHADTRGAEIETRFLIPGEVIFAADFEDGKNPTKPTWFLRKSNWTIEDGVLQGVNVDGNGPFIRLHSKEKGGPLPEDYIMKFSFMTKANPKAEQKRKPHPTLSAGHRFSFGHYNAKYNWRAGIGIHIDIGHGHALQDPEFHIEKGKWYHITAEFRGDEVLVWFKDGPAYYMQHELVRSKPAGWEFFTHISEVGYLDNLKVRSLADGERKDWPQLKAELVAQEQTFIAAEHPEFKTEKTDKTKK
jgi:hypothetical protein